MLHSAPSFSIFNSEDGLGVDEKELERSVKIVERIEVTGSGEFSFGKKGMGLIEEEDDDGEEEGLNLNGFQNMCNEEEPINVEEHFKRMVADNPNNPLFLRNYAQLLQSKGDLLGAEEFYLRATLADPQDGEILLQYAKLVWELHCDQDRALTYFERAALAAPQDSHVLAACASFLWEIDEDEEESAKDDQLQTQENEDPVGHQNSASKEEKDRFSPPLHLATGLGINYGYGGTNSIDCSSTDYEKAGDSEEYFKRMVEENPCNPLFLRNYAQFLSQSKGDLRGAEEYYSRAILADPGDGESISGYAKLVWEQHHDRDKAACYFERSVQASPGDSNVLAAYASFLWETGGDEHNT